MEDDFWPSVFCPGVPRNDESDIIFYYVLFIPNHQTNDVWERVKQLTEQNQLGYRSAVCPDPMTTGEHAGWFTITLHAAQTEKNKVYDALTRYGLQGYVIDWRFKTRFGADPNSQASSSLSFN